MKFAYQKNKKRKKKNNYELQLSFSEVRKYDHP